MADKEAQHAQFSLLRHPDGAEFVYVQAAIDMKAGEFAILNANGRLTNLSDKFIGMPAGCVVEPVARDEWTFLLIKNPDPRRQEQPKVQLSPEQIKKIADSKAA